MPGNRRSAAHLAALSTVMLAAAAGCATSPPSDDPKALATSAAPEEAVTPSSLDPLAGTSWTARTLIGDVVGIGHVEVRFDRSGRLELLVRTWRGEESRDAYRYEIDRDTLHVADDLGGRASIEFDRFGSDLVLRTPSARIGLRQVGGDLAAPPEFEFKRTGNDAIDDDPDHPLRGTTWRLMRAIGTEADQFDDGTLEFRDDGGLLMRLERRDGSSNIVLRRYAVDGSRMLIVDTLGLTTPGTIDRRLDRMTIDTPAVRLRLERVLERY